MTETRPLDLAWREIEEKTCLRVRGWTRAELGALRALAPSELGRRLAVLPSELVEVGVAPRDVQCLAGRFEVDGSAVRFIPRFPFLDGMSYALLVDISAEGSGVGAEVWTITRPPPQGVPTARVVEIYPTAGELPVNQLKLYVLFSQPMSEGWAARAVRVHRTDDGTPLEGVFLPAGPELWDRDRTRLTLLLDPGRIKRGLVPNREMGYPLVEGVPIVVTVDARFRDATGLSLQAGAQRTYAVGPPARARVDPASWRCDGPPAGSRDPLTVEFDRPLDRGLLEHCLQVQCVTGGPLVGTGSIGPEERRWRFAPDARWQEGRYQVTVDPRLEDLAGNSLVRVFDRDLTRPEDAPAGAPPTTIEFTCAPTTSRRGALS